MGVHRNVFDYMYLYRHRFTMKTNNNPLTYILTTAKIDTTGQTWVSALPAFNLNFYKPEKKNVVSCQAVYRKTQVGTHIMNMVETA